jgi:acetyl esterase/lipase
VVGAIVSVLGLAACAVPPDSGVIPTWKTVPPSESAVAYGPHSQQVLDIYQAVHGKAQGTLVYVHGGSFVGGHREQVVLTNPELLGLTELGWSVVTIDYRLDPSTARIASQVDDVRRALRWIRSNGLDHDLDTSTVIVVGQSAGGSLAMLGASDTRQRWDADAWVVIAAVGDLVEWTSLTRSRIPTNESLAEMSPVAHIGDATTPGFVMHAVADDVVPVSHARRVVRAARQSGVPVLYDEIDATPGCHPHSATCGMDEKALLDWLRALASPVSRPGR